jgi:predicted Rossmann-fold nucleotide-binding protein
MKLIKIISGGQTGVDRAALDAAIACNYPYSGSIPKGRRAEDGVIDLKYRNLVELESSDYITRTEKNVKDADATLIINMGMLEGGTSQTYDFVLKYNKPCLIVNIDVDSNPVQNILNWIKNVNPDVLNVAGPRESKYPGIYKKTFDILVEVLEKLKDL